MTCIHVKNDSQHEQRVLSQVATVRYRRWIHSLISPAEKINPKRDFLRLDTAADWMLPYIACNICHWILMQTHTTPQVWTRAGIDAVLIVVWIIYYMPFRHKYCTVICGFNGQFKSPALSSTHHYASRKKSIHENAPTASGLQRPSHPIDPPPCF